MQAAVRGGTLEDALLGLCTLRLILGLVVAGGGAWWGPSIGVPPSGKTP